MGTRPQGEFFSRIVGFVDDVDVVQQRAVQAGCEVIYEVMDAFWGDRSGKVKDPYGHVWAIATHKWIYTPAEMKEGEKKWLESLES